MTDPAHALPFDLRSLEIFLVVCDAGSMAAAARSLGITQPAISLAIAELERKTGAVLFDRDVRPLGLTPEGILLRQRGSQLLAEARLIGPQLRDLRRGKASVIRIGMVDSVNRALTAPLADYLTSKATEVSILSGLTSTHASELLTRRLDLFLGVDDLGDLPGFERWELATEPYILVVPAQLSHPRTLKDMRTLVRQTPFIRFSARSRTGIDIERHLRRLGLDPPRSLEFDTPYGVTAMVAAGRGFAITTPLCLHEEGSGRDRIAATKLPGAQINRTITLVARNREFGRIPKDLAHIAKERLSRAISEVHRTFGF
jgi:DNA-binding transcriptional LysR family regulator